MEQKYVSKIVKDPSTNLVICNFETEEEIENYKTLHKINFKKGSIKTPDLSTPEGIQYENQRIASVLNLRERLHDVNLSEEYCRKLRVPDAKIVIVDPGYSEKGNYRDGTAVHISKNHSEIGTSIKHINKIMSLFENPEELRVAMQTDIYNRYVFSVKYDEKKIYYILVDKKDDNSFELFDVFIRSSTDFNNNITKGKIIEK